jgi:hypothetical protein
MSSDPWSRELERHGPPRGARRGNESPDQVDRLVDPEPEHLPGEPCDCDHCAGLPDESREAGPDTGERPWDLFY